MSDRERSLLRHFLATLAYRTAKAVRDAPAGFGEFRVAPGVRTPHQLVHHMTGVLRYALSFFEPTETRLPPCKSLARELEAFHEVLEALGAHLDRGTPFGAATADRILQGPLSDAMTHAGQLAMLRRLAGRPVAPENFIEADIRAENVSAAQAPPTSPDAEWTDAEGKRQRD